MSYIVLQLYPPGQVNNVLRIIPYFGKFHKLALSSDRICPPSGLGKSNRAALSCFLVMIGLMTGLFVSAEWKVNGT